MCSWLQILSSHFPGGPVVKTLHFHCRGHGFSPWLGNKDPTCCSTAKGKKKSSHPTEVVVIVLLLWLGTLWDSQSRVPHWLVTRSDKLSSFIFTQISACPLLTPSSVTHSWFGFVFTCNSNKHLSHENLAYRPVGSKKRCCHLSHVTRPADRASSNCFPNWGNCPS